MINKCEIKGFIEKCCYKFGRYDYVTKRGPELRNIFDDYAYENNYFIKGHWYNITNLVFREIRIPVHDLISDTIRDSIIGRIEK